MIDDERWPVDCELQFRVVPVTRLIGSDYTTEKVPSGCMGRRALLWRVLRRFRVRCCWYHGGDWRPVIELAVRLLRQAQQIKLDERFEIARYVLDQPVAKSLSGWQREALWSLFRDPITPPEEGEEFYANGRHRARALRDAGVKQVVVADKVWIYDDAPPGAAQDT